MDASVQLLRQIEMVHLLNVSSHDSKPNNKEDVEFLSLVLLHFLNNFNEENHSLTSTIIGSKSGLRLPLNSVNNLRILWRHYQKYQILLYQKVFVWSFSQPFQSKKLLIRFTFESFRILHFL